MEFNILAELQERIVTTIAVENRGGWDFIVINIEVDTIDGDRTENCLAFSFIRENSHWRRAGFELPIACYDLFVELREVMASAGEAAWKTCMLEIDSGGEFRFSYSHDEPKRLNGLHDDGAMLRGYIPQSL